MIWKSANQIAANTVTVTVTVTVNANIYYKVTV
jgi:hypothetical protein